MFGGVPALSRDGRTYICVACETRENQRAIGRSEEEIDEIIEGLDAHGQLNYRPMEEYPR